MSDHHHNHSHAHTAHAAHAKGSLKKALAIACVFMVVELIGGWLANSLALMTDALHVSTDAASLALALVVAHIMLKPKTKNMTYGFQRAEVLGAFISAWAIILLCAFLVYEAIERFLNPPNVAGEMVFFIALLGLGANVWMMRILHSAKNDNLNTKTAYLHVWGDLLASIAVVFSGLVIWFTNWHVIDPIVTLGISVILFQSAFQIIKKSTRILMQGVPEDINISLIEQELSRLPGVVNVHGLHVWALSSQEFALNVHLVVDNNSADILDLASQMIQEKHNIERITVQIETQNGKTLTCH